jgi:hypothetical protein
MRIEFLPVEATGSGETVAGANDEVVGTATWERGRFTVTAADPAVRSVLEHLFRPTPVVVDDPSLRSLGAHGESVIQPGSIEWFRAAAFARAPHDGLRARLVPEMTGGGWDPAAAYRTFDDAMERLLDGAPDEPAA